MKPTPRKPSALELFLQAYTGEQTVTALLAAYNEHAAANGHVVVSERVLENILTSSLRMEVGTGGTYRQRPVRVEAIARAPPPAAAAAAPAAASSKAAAAAPAASAREAPAAAASAVAAASPAAAAAAPSSAPAPVAVPAAASSATSSARASSAGHSGAPVSAPAPAESSDIHDDGLRVADVAADWLGTSPQNSAAQPALLPSKAPLGCEPFADAGGGGGGGNGSRATASDDECFVTGTKRERVTLPHARYDCAEFLFHDDLLDTEKQRHCDQCWCALCQFPASQCLDWARHCRTNASQADAIAATARAAALQSRLRSVPRVQSPPAAGSPAAALLLDYRWLQLRSDALHYLNNLGNDEDGLTATLVGRHEVSPDFAHRVISALRATNDIIEVDNKLHLRPGALIGAPPPLLGPPGVPLHAWISMPAPAEPADEAARRKQAEDEVQSRMTAAAQAQQQGQAYHTYFTNQARIEAQTLAAAVNSTPNASSAAATTAFATGAAWQNFYTQQLRSQQRAMPQFTQTLVQSFMKYYAKRNR